ncbi:hypothetical protein LJR225_003580 [Phenylobacterium sp. LjRoot225]|uniref:hypothetical protein n=1 Tax=Phenylobacterium sp. LjRoot225 TaxID=3342285 RepID=UPI003ECD7086
MANERTGMPEPPKGVANENRTQAERYPQVNQTDAILGERRSFEPAADLPESAAERRLGPGGDPAEGKP